MKIGIDIDDTISCTFETIFPDSQKYDIDQLGNTGTIQNYGKILNHNYIEAMYPHWTHEQLMQFWTLYFKKALVNASIKPYAAEVIQKLQEEGNEIYIITSRHEEPNQETEKNTSNWLKKHGITTKNLLINVQNKGKTAKELQLDLLIDDSIEHCQNAIKEGTKALLVTSCMNEGIDVPELERVFSWIQIYHICHRIQNEILGKE